jgi:hypothetical protein
MQTALINICNGQKHFLKNGCETWDACFVCVSWDEAAGMSERRQTI